jgi:ribose transport system ATP-binding protein
MSEPRASDTHPGAAALSIVGLSKRFARNWALRDVGLEVRPGEIHALVGENGSGKSTLIKILSGYHLPEPGGRISVGGRTLSPGRPTASHRLGCRFVHQDLGLVDALSVADNLSLGVGYPQRMGTIRSGRWLAEIREALELLELDVDPNARVELLSPAARTGVALARALRQDTHGAAVVLVLDEPTASLPSPQVAQLHRMVRTVAARALGVLYVSHHLQEIFALADTVSVLRDGAKVTTSPISGLDHRALVRHMVGSELSVAAARPAAREGARVAMRVQGLSYGRLRDLSLRTHAGEIVGLAGIAGSGRESALSTIFGVNHRRGGSVEVRGAALGSGDPRRSIALGLAYLPPDRKLNAGMMSLSARENFSITNLRAFWQAPLLRGRREQATAGEWFRRLDVRPDDAAERPLETLSGGNQQKVLLAKWLQRAPDVLLLEEPTQGVDIGAKALLHRHITDAAATGTSVLISSADDEELAQLCDRVIVLERGAPIVELHGASLTNSAITDASLGLVTAGVS